MSVWSSLLSDHSLATLTSRLQAADLARKYFKDSPNVFVVDDVPIDDGWTRDWGPTVRTHFKICDVVAFHCVRERANTSTCWHRSSTLRC